MLPAERSSLVKLVRRWGGSTSDAVLDPAMKVFQHPGIQGFMSYRPVLGCAVVFGDPICPPRDRERLATAFHRFAQEGGYHVIYVAASRSYAHWAVNHVCKTIIEFGKELIFHPPTDPRKNKGAYGSLVRRKTKQACRQGVRIQEYIPYDPVLESAIEQVKEQWLDSRKGLQVHISNVYLFSDCFGKRWFYAKLGEKVLGVIAFNQLQVRNGWLLNHLMVVPDAPHGVSELLMATALETLEKEGCLFATVGAIAAPTLGEIQGLSPLASWMIRLVFKITSKVIRLEGLNTFWGKFHPTSEPSYLIFSQKTIGIKELWGIKKAMNSRFKGTSLG
jgi:lysylphosphatidylglycerol synthetase-like protein (DUF2156 family)